MSFGERLRRKRLTVIGSATGIRNRLNSVCPGFTEMPFNRQTIDDRGGREAQAELVKRIAPLERQSTPEDIAPLYALLASECHPS